MRKLFGRSLAVLVLVVLFACRLSAQTTTSKLEWQHDTDLATVQGYTFVLKADALAAVLVPATCVATSPVLTTCNTPLLVNLTLPHTIILSAVNASGIASGTLNYVPPPSPIPSKQLKVIIQITVP
jgi:hypothetical protein